MVRFCRKFTDLRLLHENIFSSAVTTSLRCVHNFEFIGQNFKILFYVHIVLWKEIKGILVNQYIILHVAYVFTRQSILTCHIPSVKRNCLQFEVINHNAVSACHSDSAKRRPNHIDQSYTAIRNDLIWLPEAELYALWLMYQCIDYVAVRLSCSQNSSTEFVQDIESKIFWGKYRYRVQRQLSSVVSRGGRHFSNLKN